MSGHHKTRPRGCQGASNQAWRSVLSRRLWSKMPLQFRINIISMMRMDRSLEPGPSSPRRRTTEDEGDIHERLHAIRTTLLFAVLLATVFVAWTPQSFS